MRLPIPYLLLFSFTLFFGACTYQEIIRDGKTAYERKQFDKAIPLLEKEYQKEKELKKKGLLAYMLAESFRRNNRIQEASNWYQKAQKAQFRADTDLKYARILQQLQDYDAAKRAFQNAGRYEGNARTYQEEMISCELAKKWLKAADENDLKVESLDINTEATDFCPIYFKNDKILFSSDRSLSKSKDKYKWTGNSYFDLYLLDLKNNRVQLFDSIISNDYHLSNPSFTQDYSNVYFNVCGSDEQTNDEFCKIMFSTFDGAEWSDPLPLDLGKTVYNYLHPIISPDGKILYFASNDKKGYGGYDLYYSIKLEFEEDKWSTPYNLGAKINTEGNEVFPYLKGDSLFFSSDGHAGMGGLDIFFSKKIRLKWQKPENLKAPLNSGGDDFGICFGYNNKDTNVISSGFFSSNRLGGKGSDDIYRFNIQKPKVQLSEDTIPTQTTLAFNINLSGIVKEKLYIEPTDPNSGVRSLDPLMGASIHVSNEDTAFTVGSELDGTFECTLDSGYIYQLKVTKNGYFSSAKEITTEGLIDNKAAKDTTLYIEFVLEKIIKDKEIVLENIYYDYDDDKIRKDAESSLDSLVSILKLNSRINIQLSSHTDCRGANSYNEQLSQRRAESAVNYLIQKGIDPDRLIAKGYGENKLALNCKCSDCTDEEHQRNRRTTFKVL